MYKLFAVLVIITAILLVSCAREYTKSDGIIVSPLPRQQTHRSTNTVQEQEVTNIDLITDDNVKLRGTFYKGRDDKPSIILLHMLNRNRNDWNNFADMSQSIGYNVITIDFRGHGESSLNWKDFSQVDFNNMILDVKSAKEYLIANSVSSEVVIMGASIGANVALNYAALDKSIRSIILLSPGLDYRGVKTEDTIKKFINPVLIVASEDDFYASQSSRTLSSLSKNSTLKIYMGSAHGTGLFDKTDVNHVIVDWLEINVK